MSVRRGLRPRTWSCCCSPWRRRGRSSSTSRRPGPKPVSAASAAAGRELFNHEWTPDDPLTKGDGLGPVFNARSCVECHSQGGPGGGGPVAKNVAVYGLLPRRRRGIPRSGVVHQKAVRPEFQETLDLVHSGLPHEPSIPLALLTGTPRITLPAEVVVTQRNTPALFGDGLIDAVPDETLIAHQREHSTAARLVGLNGAQRQEGPRPDRPAGRRPDRPVRLEVGVRHAQRVRQGGLRQRARPVEPRPPAGDPAGQAGLQGRRAST